VLCLGLIVLLSFSALLPFVRIELVLANPDELKWSVVDSPNKEDNVVVSPSEINALVTGSDEETFYAVVFPMELSISQSMVGLPGRMI